MTSVGKRVEVRLNSFWISIQDGCEWSAIRSGRLYRWEKHSKYPWNAS